MRKDRRAWLILTGAVLLTPFDCVRSVGFVRGSQILQMSLGANPHKHRQAFH
jgi:hypothetical protein